VNARYRLTASLVLLTAALAVAGFGAAMAHVGGAVPLGALAGSAFSALGAWLALGAPLTRRDIKTRQPA
jgi:hypothetical protein